MFTVLDVRKHYGELYGSKNRFSRIWTFFPFFLDFTHCAPLILTWTPSRSQIYTKNQENKISYPNFRHRFPRFAEGGKQVKLQ